MNNNRQTMTYTLTDGPRTGQRITVEIAVVGPCACGGEITLGYERRPDGSEGDGVVLHNRTPCADYLQLDPLAFLANNRRKLGIPDAPDVA